MRYVYREEPGRLVLALSEIDLWDRRPLEVDGLLRINLGRRVARVPAALDWDLHGRWQPATVVFDPAGRVWEPVEFTDEGRGLELWTPRST